MQKEIMIVDGQGGKMGQQLITALKKEFPEVRILAVGTNSIATANMLKGGADQAATGENPVVVGSRNADIIVGPVGIVMADALFGEVTPAMAAAIAGSRAVKVLLPVNKCNHYIVGVTVSHMSDLLKETVDYIRKALAAGHTIC